MVTRLFLMIMVFGFVTSANVAGASERHVIMWEGQKRSYEMVIPDHSKRLPLVILLHGHNKTAKIVLKQADFPDIAIRENFVLVAPEGINRSWNDGRSVMEDGKPPSGADDVGFILKIIELLDSSHAIIDPRRIYVVGASNGGLMALRFACERPDVFAAAAVVSATMPEALPHHCRAKPIPIQFIIGTEDPIIPWDGGDIMEGNKVDPMLSGLDTVAWWLKHNHCKEPGITDEMPHLDEDDETTVTRISYKECADSGRVEFYRINGGGHGWPQFGKERRAAMPKVSSLGKANGDINPAEVIWAFFKRQ